MLETIIGRLDAKQLRIMEDNTVDSMYLSQKNQIRLQRAMQEVTAFVQKYAPQEAQAKRLMHEYTAAAEVSLREDTPNDRRDARQYQAAQDARFQQLSALYAQLLVPFKKLELRLEKAASKQSAAAAKYIRGVRKGTRNNALKAPTYDPKNCCGALTDSRNLLEALRQLLKKEENYHV
jgi:hypothetical protein